MNKQGSKTGTQTPNTRRDTSPEQLWVAIAHSYHAISFRIEESFADAGLSLTDFMLLEALLHKGPLTIKNIQAAALLATGSMTAAVDRLEGRELIIRTLSPGDRRARILELTPAGRTAIKAAYAQHSAQLKQWMSALSGAERSVTFASLRKLEKALKAVPKNPPS